MRCLKLHPTGILLRPDNNASWCVRSSPATPRASCISSGARSRSASRDRTDSSRPSRADFGSGISISTRVGGGISRKCERTSSAAAAFRGPPALHRRAFLRRVCARIRRLLQSLHRAASGPDRPRRGRTAFHPQPARDRRRAHLVDRISHRRHSRDHSIAVDETSPFRHRAGAQSESRPIARRVFLHKLMEMGFENDWSASVMGHSLNDASRLHELESRDPASSVRRSFGPCRAKCSAPSSACAGWRSRTTKSISIRPSASSRAHHLSRLVQ